MLLGNLQLLFENIAAKRNNLHTIEQRWLNVRKTIGCSDKKDTRKIVVNTEVIIVEVAVLFRVENLEESRRWISGEVVALHFVYLIEYENRIGGTGFSDFLYDPSRHSTDVSATMSAYFRLIVQATKSHTAIGTSHCSCNTTTYRCLARARRPNKTEYLCLTLNTLIVLPLHNSKVFNNSIFYLLNAIMVSIHNTASLSEVKTLWYNIIPR